MSRDPKVSQMTAAVLMARAKYPQLLDAVVSRLATPAPYMQRRLDPRARDKMLLTMTPEDMASLARSDPQAAEIAAARISELESNAPPLPPGMGDWEAKT